LSTKEVREYCKFKYYIFNHIAASTTVTVLWLKLRYGKNNFIDKILTENMKRETIDTDEILHEFPSKIGSRN